MSEFKFACPVCGQHITADARSSGSQLECPTCFRKIVVPQAPATPDPKFILSASEVSSQRPRTSSAAVQARLKSSQSPRRSSTALLIACGLLALGVAAAAVYGFRDKIFGRKNQPGRSDPKTESAAVPGITNNVPWTLATENISIPVAPVEGKIHGEFVACNRVTLTGGALGFRQAKRDAPDLGLTIHFFSKRPEELSGRKIEITADETRVPKITLRWKENGENKSRSFNRGYALKLEVGEIAGNHVPGKIYLALPDEDQTRIAGTFSAEIKTPSPPKPKPPLPQSSP